MKSLFVLTFAVNLVLLFAAYRFLGIVIAILVALVIYFFVSKQFPFKSGLGEKLSLASVHLFGVFAVQSLMHNPFITLAAVIIEAVSVIIFFNVSD